MLLYVSVRQCRRKFAHARHDRLKLEYGKMTNLFQITPLSYHSQIFNGYSKCFHFATD